MRLRGIGPEVLLLCFLVVGRRRSRSAGARRAAGGCAARSTISPASITW